MSTKDFLKAHRMLVGIALGVALAYIIQWVYKGDAYRNAPGPTASTGQLQTPEDVYSFVLEQGKCAKPNDRPGAPTFAIEASEFQGSSPQKWTVYCMSPDRGDAVWSFRTSGEPWRGDDLE